MGVPTCTLGDIPAGTQAQYTATTTVNVNAAGEIINTAAVNTTSSDSDVTNDTSVSGGLGVVLTIPTLGPLGLVAMSVLLLLVAGLWLRRRLLC